MISDVVDLGSINGVILLIWQAHLNSELSLQTTTDSPLNIISTDSIAYCFAIVTNYSSQSQRHRLHRLIMLVEMCTVHEPLVYTYRQIVHSK